MKLREALGQWLFRFGRDEQLPVVLTQRRIFILPTRAGLLYGVVLCVMLIGAINYNLSLGHALVFLLAGLGLVAMVHTFRNLLGLRLMPGRADPVFAGEVGLSGEIRAVSRIEQRISEAEKLGFKRIFVPLGNKKGFTRKATHIEVAFVSRITDICRSLFG